MRDGDLLILNTEEVRELLSGQETAILETVQRAYESHALGESSLPHSTFLRFPNSPRDRIIALPAYLGDGWEMAGIKWISSFPGNHDLGLERASALVVLNSARTGRPEAILEGSVISARRTAASAALGAKWLHGDHPIDQVGMIGTGLINSEILRFLLNLWPDLPRLRVFDLNPAQAQRFAQRVHSLSPSLRIDVADSIDEILANCPLITFATTAVEPHVSDLSACRPGTTILHISLRDLSPEAILDCDNVVDDIDHVCRAQTSIHLAEQLVGSRNFIRCTLADVFRGVEPTRKPGSSVTVFSPFGLGVLDLAVSAFVRDRAVAQGWGMVIPAFLPAAEKAAVQGTPH